MNVHECRTSLPCSSSSKQCIISCLDISAKFASEGFGIESRKRYGSAFFSLSPWVYVCYEYGYVIGYDLVQTAARMERIGKGFDIRLCDSMLLAAYRDISRGQSTRWIMGYGCKGSWVKDHGSFVMNYGVWDRKNWSVRWAKGCICKWRIMVGLE